MISSRLINEVRPYWTSAKGPFSEIVYSINFNKNNICFAGTFSGGLYKSNESKTFWYKTYINNTYVKTIFSYDNNIIIGTEKDIYLSYDNGSSWKRIFINLDVLSINKDKNNYLYAGTLYNGLFQSKNNGLSWNKIGLENFIIKSICFYNELNKLIIGTEYGILIYDYNEFKKLPNLNSNINKIFNYQNKIFVASDSKIYILNEKLEIDIINTKHKNIWDILIYKGKIIIATDNGIFILDKNNSVNISSGLNSKKVYSLSLSLDKHLYCGTFGWGVFKTRKDIDSLFSEIVF